MRHRVGLGTMVDPKISWIERIPILQDYASQLLSIANDIVSFPVRPYDSSDYLGLMIDTFTNKQIEHLKSICLLVEAKQYPDAEIVSRVSIEGMYLLLWAAHGPKDNPGKIRPLKWWSYQFIEEYRKMIKNDVNDIDLKIETAIFEGVKEYSHLFLTKKYKDLLRRGKVKESPDDPYIVRWPSENLEQITEELENLGKISSQFFHYKTVYRGFSQWLHWTPRGIGKVFCWDINNISRNTNNCEFMGVGAIIMGLQSLATSAHLFNDRFKLDFQGKLNDL